MRKRFGLLPGRVPRQLVAALPGAGRGARTRRPAARRAAEKRDRPAQLRAGRLPAPAAAVRLGHGAAGGGRAARSDGAGARRRCRADRLGARHRGPGGERGGADRCGGRVLPQLRALDLERPGGAPRAVAPHSPAVAVFAGVRVGDRASGPQPTRAGPWSGDREHATGGRASRGRRCERAASLGSSNQRRRRRLQPAATPRTAAVLPPHRSGPAGHRFRSRRPGVSSTGALQGHCAVHRRPRRAARPGDADRHGRRRPAASRRRGAGARSQPGPDRLGHLAPDLERAFKKVVDGQIVMRLHGRSLFLEAE